MKSDIALFIKYDREIAGDYSRGFSTLELVRDALNNDIVDTLDLTVCQAIIEEVMAYLLLKKRFLLLKKEVGDKLSLSKEGFKLYENTFLSLDELEKAFKMKAFL